MSLDDRIAGGLGQRPFHEQLPIPFVHPIKALGFMILGAEHLGQPLPLDHLLGGAGEFPH